ncbi:MAG: DUF4252 domain-containing protein [Bacteroidales bacterium]
MKALVKFLLLFLLVAPSTIFAQDRKMDELYKKYSTEKGFEAFQFTPEMFKLVANLQIDSLMTPQEKAIFENNLTKLKSIKVLTYKANQENPLNFNNIIAKEFPTEKYKLLFESINQDESFRVRARYKEDKNEKSLLDEIIAIKKSPKSTTLINIDAIVTLKDFMTIMKIAQEKNKELLFKK